jgi:hypothetical protein
VTGFYVDQTVKRARDGDVDAARVILDDFVGAITARSERTWDGPIYYQYAQYLADAFQKILSGAKSDIALGIKCSKPGRRRSQHTDTKLEAIAAGFELLLRKGFTLKRATDALEQYFSRRTIQRAREANPWMDSRKLFRDELLKVTAQPIAPKIQMILDANTKR